MVNNFFDQINGMGESDSGYIVAWEWDSKQPPSMYYRRMKKMGFKVGVHKEGVSPLARRANEKESGGVIFQEGMAIVPKLSTARVIYWLVSDLGAASVVMGKASLTDMVFKSKADVEILNRIERKFGRRGKRPPKENWALSCTDCLRVSHIHDWAPLECPYCDSYLTRARKGTPITYTDPNTDILDTWLRTRFSGPHWEPVTLDPKGIPAPAIENVIIGNSRESNAVDWMKDSPSLINTLTNMPRDVALEFLDGILISVAHRDKDERNIERAYIAAEYMKRGGDPVGIAIVEPNRKKELDIALAAPVLSRNVIVSWLLTLDKSGKT